MKKILLFGAIFFLISQLISCKNDNPFLDTKMPKASFTTSTLNTFVGDTIKFTNASENATSYYWDFDDGSGSDEMHPSHIYLDEGTYAVVLTAIGNDVSDTTTQMVQINAIRYVDFSVDRNIATVGEDITFINQSSGYSSFVWDFGDGKTSQTFDDVHTYTLENEYTVRLTADKIQYAEKTVKVLTPSNRWAYFVNHNIKHIDSVYHENAFILTVDGRVFRNKVGIIEFYSGIKDTFNHVRLVSAMGTKNDRFSSSVKYEIGYFIIDNDKVYKHLIIWQKVQGVFLRRFEIISPSDAFLNNVDFLVERRKDWVKGSNSHNAKAFVAEIYTEDAFYFWHSKNFLAIGNEAVADAYNYMNNSSWSIKSLTPYHCEPVHSNLVFEIGVYSGAGGTGEYVLVWRKDIDGIWRVLFDSNY